MLAAGVPDAIGSGGVAGAAVVGLGYVLWYLIKRRGSETGVVETTRETLKLVRDDQKIMGAELRTVRTENVELRAEARARGHEVAELKVQNEALVEQLEAFKAQNEELRRRLDSLEEERDRPLRPVAGDP